MKAFIRSTSWTAHEPNVIRVELEIGEDRVAARRVLAGNYAHIHGESRWERLINKFRRTA